MPSAKANETPSNEDMWKQAISDAEAKIQTIECERKRLKTAVRLMRRQIKDGVPWPTHSEPLRGDEALQTGYGGSK